MLVLVGTCSAIDRVAISTMGPAIARDLGLSDLKLGLASGFGFALLYAVLGLPIARLADSRSRVRLIAISVGVWAVVLMLSGMVRNFYQLLACRMIIGIGEAGVQPPAVSLVSDLYPRNRRGAALGVMALGVPLGTVIGSAGAGYLAEALSWRIALMLMGAPALILAALAWLTLREPPRGMSEEGNARADMEPPSLATIARLLAARRSFWHLLAAIAIVDVAIYGIGMFLPQYFTRVVHLSLSQTGVVYGIVGALSTVGYVFGGALADRAARHDERWYGWLCAIGVLAGAPLYIAAFQTLAPIVATVLLTLGGICMFLFFTPAQVILQNMVEPKMRATTAFIFFFVGGLVGAGFGPALVGLLSDSAASYYFKAGDYAITCAGGVAIAGTPAGLSSTCSAAAADGIRTALSMTSYLFIWAAIHFFLAARTLRSDLMPAKL